MYNVFFSRMEVGILNVSDRLKEIINPDSKVLILPWAFPVEIDGDKFDNDFFKKGERRYNRYIDSLKNINLKEKNIIVANCYKDSKEELKKMISNSEVLLLPGGNPEMFFKKVVQDTELLYDIKHYKGIIIGESAGTELQLTRYFITAKNNYYKYFAFYDGFGVLNDPFYLDVHSIDNKNYLNKLQIVSDETKKNIFAIYDDGCIIYEKKLNKLELFGKVKEFNPKSVND